MPSERNAGGRAGFRGLFDQYYRPVVRFFRRWGFDAEEAADLAQETFLRAYRGLDAYRAEASHSTWLFTIAANTMRNELRRRSAGKRAAIEIPHHDLPRTVLDASSVESGRAAHLEEPLERLLKKEESRALREAVADLPPQMRRCVELRIERGLKLREIAILQRVSVETVKAHLFQAKKRLRHRVAELFEAVESGETEQV